MLVLACRADLGILLHGDARHYEGSAVALMMLQLTPKEGLQLHQSSRSLTNPMS